MNISELQQRFLQRFGHPAAGAVRAPGRVNLIGEHTDYNDGFVLPIAIERHTVALYAPKPGAQVRFASSHSNEEGTIDLTSTIQPGQPHWANYCKGVAAGLAARGLKLSAADILFESDVPAGAGLSSSAALEVSTALALMAASGAASAVAGHELALLCQKAEHVFAGAPCGIMDQSISILGQAACALLLDCRSGKTKHVPFNDPHLVLLVADTQVKHAISDGGYATRRKQCESAAAKMGIKALRDATEASLAASASKLTDKELMRARHVVTEIARTLAAVDALQEGDYRKFGKLMYASHASCRDDYEISCEELNEIVELARRSTGVYGARMTGGGFGGSAIVLSEATEAKAIIDKIQKGFAAKYGRACPIFATHAAQGAGPLK